LPEDGNFGGGKQSALDFFDIERLAKKILNGGQERFAVERFFNEFFRAASDGANGHGNVTIAGDDEHGKTGLHLFHFNEKIDAAEAFHVDISNQKMGFLLFKDFQAFLGGPIAGDFVSLTGEDSADGLADLRLVIDEENMIVA